MIVGGPSSPPPPLPPCRHLTHRKDHPYNQEIVDWSRDHCFGVRGKPCFDIQLVRHLPDVLHMEINAVSYGVQYSCGT